jgi:hypothetical protein
MVNDIENPLITEYSARFGMKALDMGFVTIDQVLEALSAQAMENYTNKRHKLLGTIFVEKGWMTTEQVGKVLESNAEDREKNNKALITKND